MLTIHSPSKELTQWAYIYADLLDILECDKVIDIGQLSKRDIKKHKIKGYCVDDGCDIIIGLDANDNDILTTLAHEMVHAKQYIKGELRDSCLGIWWKRRYYKNLSQYDINSPWENEAYKLQDELFKKAFERNWQ